MHDTVDLLHKDCEETGDKLRYAKGDLKDLQKAKDDSERSLNQTINDLQA
jgi:hypothetical protein